jgi:hypothetical protein
MFTGGWSAEDVRTYAAILGVSPDDIAAGSPVPNDRNREHYFSCVPRDLQADVFVDPDTGMRVLHERPEKGNRARRPQWSDYFFVPELQYVLPRDCDRIVAVYDQSLSRGSEREAVQTKLLSVAPLLGLAYVAQAAMFVIGRDNARSRLTQLRDQLQKREEACSVRLMSSF